MDQTIQPENISLLNRVGHTKECIVMDHLTVIKPNPGPGMKGLGIKAKIR